MNTATTFSKNNLYASIILSVVTFGIYLNSTSGLFVFDDWVLIVGNSKVHFLEEWKRILGGYRPIRTLVLAILYHFFGENPVGYHVVNLLIHVMTTLVAFHLVRVLTHQTKTAFLSALVFAVHPIQTDSVAYISGIRDTLSGLFYLTSFYLFLVYRKTPRVGLLMAFLLFNGLGLFTKESAASLVFMYFMYDFTKSMSLLNKPSLKEFLRGAFTKTVEVLKTYRWFYSGLILFFFWSVWYYVWFRKSSVRISGEVIHWYTDSLFLNYLSIPKIILYYIKQLLYPVQLLADYKFYPILADSAFEPQAIASLIGVLAIILLAFWLVTYRWIASFSIFWFFVALSPGMNILPHHEFMAEHYLYIPSFGFALLVGSTFASGWTRPASTQRNIVVVSVFCLLVASYGIRTVVRNQDWQNDLTLSASQLGIRPDSPRTLAELGHLYIRMDLLESAEEALNRALELVPTYAGARNNLGVVYSHRGHADKAVQEFKTVIDVGGKWHLNTYANLGVVYMMLEDEERAVQNFEKGLEWDPIDHLSLISMTYIYMGRKDYEKAAEYVRRNLKYRSKDVEAYYLLAEIYRKNFKFDTASQIYDIIMDIDPEDPDAPGYRAAAIDADRTWKEIQKQRTPTGFSVEGYLKIVDLYRSVNELDQAPIDLERALENDPDQFELLKSFAEVWFDLGRYDESEALIQRALSIRSDDVEARLLLAKLYALDLQFDRAESELKQINPHGLDQANFKDISRAIRENSKRYQKVKALELSESGSGEAKFLLGTIYQSFGLTEESIQLFSEIDSDRSLGLKARHELVKIYLGQKGIASKAEAVAVLEEIIRQDDTDTKAYNQLGLTYLSDIKDYERAARYFSKSLEVNPNQKKADRIRSLLAGITQYTHAVLVENRYLVPYIEDMEGWTNQSTSN